MPSYVELREEHEQLWSTMYIRPERKCLKKNNPIFSRRMPAQAQEISGVAQLWPAELRKISFHVLICAAVFMVGCSEPPEIEPRLQPPLVRVAIAQEAQASERSFTGVVAARVLSELGFRVDGKVTQRFVDVGQRVKRGQILMRLDPEDLHLALTSRLGDETAARARYLQAKADEARMRGLAKTGAVSAQEYDQVVAILRSSQAQFDAAQAQVNVARNATQYAELKADTDGVIVATQAEPGQVVAAGQTVIQLAKDGPREAAISLPETLRPALGSQASAALYGSSASMPAVLRELSDAADPATRTFAARYVLPKDQPAPLGATVTIRLKIPSHATQPRVIVPIGALQDRGKGSGVWVIDPQSKVRLRHVVIDAVNIETAEIHGDLQPGEQVVALGAHLIYEGEQVRIGESLAVLP